MNRHPPHNLTRLAYIVGLTAAVILVVGSGLQLAAAGQASWGMTVAGMDVGGKSPATIRSLLEEKRHAYRAATMRLELNGVPVQTTPETLGLDVDIDTSMDRIMTLGRTGPFYHRALSAVARLVRPANVPLVVSIDTEVLGAFLQKTFPGGEQPATNATVSLVGNRAVMTPAHDGHIIERAALHHALQTSAATLTPRAVTLDITPDPPDISTETARSVRGRVNTILRQAPIAVTVAGVVAPPTTVLTGGDIRDALNLVPQPDAGTISVDIDRSLLREFLLSTATPALNRQPVNARLGHTNGAMTIDRRAREGLTVHTTNENVARLANGILTARDRIMLAAATTQASLNEERLAELGVVDFLGDGTTDFAGSPASRKHNIGVGASIYDGVLIAPGEEFSFNEILGPVGPEQGYRPELVIKNNKTIPEYGGGLCQVSTTAFRAAVYAGLVITQRYPHSYAVRYYGTPGFDATIYPPNPDLRFRNDTPGHILIQTDVDGTAITFSFYGTDDGRTVTLEGPTVYERNPDGSMKAVLRQTVTRNGETIHNDTFWSSYKPASLYPVIRNPLE